MPADFPRSLIPHLRKLHKHLQHKPPIEVLLDDGSAEPTPRATPSPVDLFGANCAQLSPPQHEKLLGTLDHFNQRGMFPVDPKSVPACAQGELRTLLMEEACKRVAAKQ